MIKQTYKSKNGIKTTEKQALPSVQPETETRVETVLSASQVSLAAGASAPGGESGPPPHQVIKLGIDVHLDRCVVVRQIDGGAPQPPQRFSPTQFLEWAKKQTALAQQVYSCYEANAGSNRRLEFELGAWFEGACGFALVLALSQMMVYGLGPFGRADLHPGRNPLDRQGRFAPQPSKFPLLTPLDAPDFTRLAMGNPKSGPALPPGSGGSRGDARRHPFPSP